MKINIGQFALFIVIICLAGCAPKPYRSTNKLYHSRAKAFAKQLQQVPKDSIHADSLKVSPYWIGTTNFGLRKPNYVVIHHTAQSSCEQTLQTFTQDKTQVSAHYLICKDGTLHHLLNDYFRAWHAGVSKWGNETDLNSGSIGIELDNNGQESFTEAQLNTLQGLLAELKTNYKIPASNFIGHADVAPGRKVDPNINFPWKRLADSGYGLWYDDTSNIVIPQDFDAVIGLRIIGYDISNPAAAIQAFRRHFLNTETAGALSPAELKVLFMVMRKYL